MSKLSDRLADESVRPSDFMRARHPELFSDSVVATEQSLSREVFDYHLESLMNRKEETVFEHFCRRLSEKALCPNLSPQTGPTGGGDSKCDAETHPVAEQIALRWYEGDPVRAARERWAFAFSAKEDWRSKAQSDVAKIAATNRGYELIYFITSRYAKDKAKADLEDKLTKKHRITVRILDRSWIMKEVFENNRVDLAIEALHLDNAVTKSGKRLGPRDFRNTQRLHDLEERIADTTRYSGVEYQLGEDCLSAALLARGLELSRIDVEGRFDRAARVCKARSLKVSDSFGCDFRQFYIAEECNEILSTRGIYA